MENKPTILVDVDGVLRDLMGKCCQVYRRDFDPSSRVTPESIINWEIDPFFPKLPEAHKVFFGEYAEEIFTASDPYEAEMAQYMEMIQESGRLIIATDQWNGNGKYTMQWLEDQRVPYNGIFISRDKTLLKADIALDDRLSNLEAFKEDGILPVCMERPWNKDRWDGLTVTNLYGFYTIIQDLWPRNR